MKTLTIVPNGAPNLLVAELVEGAPAGEELALTPIVAWKVTVEDNPDDRDRPLVYAEPVTVDHEAEGQATIVDSEKWVWWPFGGGSGIGRDALIEYLKALA